MKRRDFLECAALLIGGVGVSQSGFSLSHEQKHYLASAPSYIERPIDYFSVTQRTLINRLIEIIIPETDTPGATEAGVGKFIELILVDWLNDEERLVFMAGLESVSDMAKNHFDKDALDLSSDELLKILSSLELDAEEHPWYDLGNQGGAFLEGHPAPFICQLKELTIYGFFTSKVGSTQVLRYMPMPMSFDGDVPLKEGDSTWAGRQT